MNETVLMVGYDYLSQLEVGYVVPLLGFILKQKYESYLI